jgi:hypothetical protein
MTFYLGLSTEKRSDMIFFFVRDDLMELAKSELELAERASRYLKAELKRADVTYEELAKRLKKHGLDETRNSVAAKLKRGTFAATFLLACLAALELEGVRLDDI